jgi:hypothetical protein
MSFLLGLGTPTLFLRQLIFHALFSHRRRRCLYLEELENVAWLVYTQENYTPGFHSILYINRRGQEKVYMDKNKVGDEEDEQQKKKNTQICF